MNLIGNNDKSSSYKGCQHPYKNTILSIFTSIILFALHNKFFTKTVFPEPEGRRSPQRMEIGTGSQKLLQHPVIRTCCQYRRVKYCSRGEAHVCHKPLERFKTALLCNVNFFLLRTMVSVRVSRSVVSRDVT